MLAGETTYDRSLQLGWFILRFGYGIMFIWHGAPKIFGGPEKWEQLGGSMEMLGIGFGYTVWGFLAGLAEFGGGICLILGLFTRPAAALLLATMLVAATRHIMNDDGFVAISHPIEAAVVFLAILIAGAGQMSLDARLFGSNKK